MACLQAEEAKKAKKLEAEAESKAAEKEAAATKVDELEKEMEVHNTAIVAVQCCGFCGLQLGARRKRLCVVK